MDELFDFEDTPEIEQFEDWKKNPKKFEYRIAIPTYKRHETLKKKTLNLLKNSGIDPDLIDVFVADNSEKELYEKTLEPGTYSKIIVGQKGMRAIRNFIQNYYPEGQRVVNLDDDVEKIQIMKDEKTILDFSDLDDFFNYAFDVCEKLKVHYWGVYGVNNPYFMDKSIALGLRYLEGSFWGNINVHDKSTYVTLDDKEDFERSLRAYVFDGSVARFDFISFESKFWTEPGGMQFDGERTPERVENSGRKLLEIFPQLCKENTCRKKHFEIKLVEQRQEYKADSKKRISWS